MTSNFSILFSIELLHEYFANGKCSGLEIVSAEDCRQLVKRMNLQSRYIDNRLIMLIQENDDHEPFYNSKDHKYYRSTYNKTVFRFYIKVADPLFSNYTNINSLTGTNKKFYFSNLSKNKQNEILYLTKPVEEFTAGTTYLPGDLVRDAVTGNVFEVIKKHIAAKKSKFNDSAVWLPKGLLNQPKKIEVYASGKNYAKGDIAQKPNTEEVYEALKRNTGGKVDELNDKTLWASRGNGQLQYTSAADIIEYCKGTYLFKLSAKVKKAKVSVSGFNYDANKPAFNVAAIEEKELNFKEPTEQVSVDLSKLNVGMYEIKINDQVQQVYYDPQLSAGNILGVIEIYNHLPAKDDYSLLTSDEQILSKRYAVQFASRSVLWKYIKKDNKAKSIIDTADRYAFKLAGDEFISETPIPLSETVLKTLKLEFKTNDFPQFPLPNPGISYLQKCTQDDYDYLCSVIQLNY